MLSISIIEQIRAINTNLNNVYCIQYTINMVTYEIEYLKLPNGKSPVIDIFIEIRNYTQTTNFEYQTSILQKIGGKIFDFILCVVGIFQALKIFTHISRITKSTSSVINVVDDV